MKASSSPPEFVESNDTPQLTPEFIEAENKSVTDEQSEASNPDKRGRSETATQDLEFP